MLLLNFSHPITPAQQSQIEALAGKAIERTLSAMPHFDEQQPFGPQVEMLLTHLPLTPTEWQTLPILAILPSLNFIAALLLAELHGRMGYFPPVVRTRPVANAVVRQYEVAEILNLQSAREAARRER